VPQTRDVDLLTESVRAGLARAICETVASPEGKLEVVSLDPALEQALQQSMREGIVAIPPQDTQDMFRVLQNHVAGILNRQERAAVVCAPRVRLAVRRLLETNFPKLPVLAYHELVPDLDVRAVAVLGMPGGKAAAPSPAEAPAGRAAEPVAAAA
jgi:flagellar biosynthesis protein FlhA